MSDIIDLALSMSGVDIVVVLIVSTIIFGIIGRKNR